MDERRGWYERSNDDGRLCRVRNQIYRQMVSTLCHVRGNGYQDRISRDHRSFAGDHTITAAIRFGIRAVCVRNTFPPLPSLPVVGRLVMMFVVVPIINVYHGRKYERIELIDVAAYTWNQKMMKERR